MARIDEARATFERNIEAQTGKSVAAWAQLVSRQSLAKHGQMVGWLKAKHGLSHAHANHIAKRALGDATPKLSGDPGAHLFVDGKQALRPLYDRIVDAARALGTDVEIAPKKANVSLRRRRQFALLQPSTRARLDLGLILKGKAASGRLEPSGSFNAMFTHRIKLATVADFDKQVLRWLKEAYDDAN